MILSSPSSLVVTPADIPATPSTPPASKLFLAHRPRRLRRTEGLRRMVRETLLTVGDLISPLFVMEGAGQRQAVQSMPGCFRYSLDLLLEELQEVVALGIGAIASRDAPNALPPLRLDSADGQDGVEPSSELS